MDRYTNGFVVRMAVPVAIFMILAGATFYVSSAESRVSAATGLLIAVAAIYITMIAYIPFVGSVIAPTLLLLSKVDSSIDSSHCHISNSLVFFSHS